MQTTADIEIYSDAPYGRKKNGQPYKTRPSMRKAILNYQSKNPDKKLQYQKMYYANNTQKHLETCLKWQRENADKMRKYSSDYYYSRKMELEYLKTLFHESLY
jgi:hypothetical protein